MSNTETADRRFPPDAEPPDWIDALRDEIRGLREEVRSLRGERDPDRNISVEEAADLAGVSQRKLEELVHSGEVPSLKIGRRRLVPYRSFTAWMRRKAEGGRRRYEERYGTRAPARS